MRIEWIETYMSEAERLIVQGQVQEGLNILNNLLFEEPGYGSLHNHIGWAHLYYTGDLKRAELHLTMAIRFAEDFAAPYLHLGTVYNRTQRFAEAVQILTKGLTRREANRVAMLETAGQAHEYRGEYRKAIKAYREAALASMHGFEMENLTAGIKRCRRKRRMQMFSF